MMINNFLQNTYKNNNLNIKTDNDIKPKVNYNFNEKEKLVNNYNGNLICEENMKNPFKSTFDQREDKFQDMIKASGHEAKRIMNSSGQNLIHNDFRGINNIPKQ